MGDAGRNCRESLVTKVQYRDFHPRFCRVPIKKGAASAAHLPEPRTPRPEISLKALPGQAPNGAKTRIPYLTQTIVIDL